MSLISYTKINDGETIDAIDVNTPLDVIFNDYNGNIDSSNLAANSVGTSEIQDGSVTGAKLSTASGEINSAWINYTPSLTNITIGNGTVKARYKIIGKTLFFKIRVSLGSSSSVGTNPTISLPSASYESTTFGLVNITTAFACDQTPNKRYVAGAGIGIGPTISYITDAGGFWSATNPITWAESDFMFFEGCLELA